MARILLVEDHEEVWHFLSRRLNRRDHEVEVTVDGGQAGDDYHPKPVDFSRLLEQIECFLAGAAGGKQPAVSAP